MRLQMQAIHFDADASLLAFIQQKMDKLDTFYDRITSGEVFLKLDGNETNKVHTKLLEVKLYVPGGTMFVKEQGTTFEEATDLAVETLKTQVKRFKNKRREPRSPRMAEMAMLVETEETEIEE
ncbi:HPF/RaiA family ribosome-associated protein [Salmonirosea aquatica]|uniref:30S ribosomal protein S30 n=1 Tax=Salmonirosea aquatica TaxID=2654236 RepID=A0A7C9FZ19_9BACT|nr:30S ribosomal protein S30 [Cytophagaceae bacterium SJW1-29]